MERPANKLIDWSLPVRSIDHPERTGIVKAADGINGKRPVIMSHKGKVGVPDAEKMDGCTTYRYDDYGRCHTHKQCSPFDLENYGPRA